MKRWIKRLFLATVSAALAALSLPAIQLFCDVLSEQFFAGESGVPEYSFLSDYDLVRPNLLDVAAMSALLLLLGFTLTKSYTLRDNARTVAALSFVLFPVIAILVAPGRIGIEWLMGAIAAGLAVGGINSVLLMASESPQADPATCQFTTKQFFAIITIAAALFAVVGSIVASA